MATFGHIAQGATHATPTSADRKFALKTVAPEDGTVSAIFCDMQNDGTDIQVYRAAIYNDAPTIPGATLVDSSDVFALAPGTTRQWVAFNTGISAQVIGGNVYWLTIHSGTTGGNGSFWYDAGVGSEIIADDPFSDGINSTFGTATSSSNSIAIYAQYTPVASQVQGLKKVTLGRKYTGVSI